MNLNITVNALIEPVVSAVYGSGS